ncbi:hypothetical protein TrRE_jg8913, partial [Triparma retinervis]
MTTSSNHITAYESLSNHTTRYLTTLVISARRHALRRLGIRTMSASVQVVLTLSDLNAALKENGGEEYYSSNLPKGAVLPRGGG